VKNRYSLVDYVSAHGNLIKWMNLRPERKLQSSRSVLSAADYEHQLLLFSRCDSKIIAKVLIEEKRGMIWRKTFRCVNSGNIPVITRSLYDELRITKPEIFASSICRIFQDDRTGEWNIERALAKIPIYLIHCKSAELLNDRREASFEAEAQDSSIIPRNWWQMNPEPLVYKSQSRLFVTQIR
jgi:hypothetical protein